MDSHIPPWAQAAVEKRAITKAIEHLTGILDGITADGRLDPRVVQFLSTWLSAHPEAAQAWPGNIVNRKVREVLSDGLITTEELTHLMGVLTELGATQFASTGSASPEVNALPIQDAVTVTMRDAGLALAAGAMPVDSVSKKVDYLVVGTRVSGAWAHTSFGRKIQRAVELQEQGHAIEIISERRWFDSLSG
jgi:hypothetical protein